MAKLVSTIAERAEALGCTALLVDTDPDSRVSLCKLLAEVNIRTVIATNSVAALAVLRSQPIDLVICEDLGGLYGVEVLEACEALFPSVRRVYLARKGPAELHCQAIVRGHVHATIAAAMHPVDLRNLIAALAIRAPR
jgi:response regulator RpfG family c-di-GMP phosphodiesterase